jgi:hypothetical protein
MLIDDTFERLHDSYIIGVEVDHLSEIVLLRMRFGDRLSTLEFRGAKRFLLTEMLMQNIVYEVKLLEPASAAYRDAVARLDQSYWKHDIADMKIAFVTASLGVEIIIEYESASKRVTGIRSA